MNKFKAINYIRSNSVMSKPVKDTYEFRCNGEHFATITKSDTGVFYIHRRNMSTFVVRHFMQAVAEILPLFLEKYAAQCESALGRYKVTLNNYKMAYERSIQNLNRFYNAPKNTVALAYGVGGFIVNLYEVEEIEMYNLRPSGYSKTLGEGLTQNIKNLEKTIDYLEKELDETITNL